MNWFKALLEILFPSNCPFCDEPTGGKPLCDTCRLRYAAETFLRCPVCGEPVHRCLCGCDFTADTKTELAGRPFLALTCYCPEGRGDEDRVTEKMLYDLKKTDIFADFFAGELGRELRRLFEKADEDPADWTVTFPPRSAENYEKTGHDQSEEVARRIAKGLGARYRSVFRRDRAAVEQKSLDEAGRRRNARDTLTLRDGKVRPGEKFLLFDDIITSGATVRAAAGLLCENGAEAVFPVSIARTLPKARK